MWKKMKKEGSSGSFRLKSNPGSLSRAVSWINFSSLSRQTKRLFRSDGELSVCGQQVEADDENWTYRTQPRKGDLTFFFFFIYTFLEVCSVQFFVSITDFRSQFLSPFGVFVVFYVGIQCQSFVYMSKVKILLQLDSTWDRVLLRRIK